MISENSFVFEGVAILFSTSIFFVVLSKLKVVAAMSQMGSIQERSSDWAQHTKSHVSSPKGGVPLEKKIEDALRMKDKLIFTFGVLNMGLSAYILGAFPQYFHLWHTPKAIFYILHRWWTFKEAGQHYYLYDFCYWANALLLIYVWVLPDNAVLFQMLYVISNGPLAWSVCAFQNSLVLHSAPHMTSVFIHTSPMLFTYAVRWYPSHFKVCDNWPSCTPTDSAAGSGFFNSEIFNRVWRADIFFYLWWAVLYYMWIYVIMAKRIRERGYETLFDYVMKATPLKNLTKLTHNVVVQRSLYLAVHVFFGNIVMLTASVFQFNSWLSHLTFCIAIFTASAYNASGYYFTVFLRRYEDSMHHRIEDQIQKGMSPEAKSD